MLLRKYMSMLGIGAAQIDLILEKETYQPGEPVYGYFLIKGGTIEQEIRRIDCDLMMIDASNEEHIIDSSTILSTNVIEPEAMNRIEFSFQLPESFPEIEAGTTFRFNTKLTFDKGVESRDMDVIRIVQ